MKRKNTQEYNRVFYEKRVGTEDRVKVIVECVANHYHGNITSAIDLGCGLGILVNSFREYYQDKCNDKFIVRGVDGDYVQKDLLIIGKNEFCSWNLEESYSDNQRYDIAISTECAEHLEPSRADSFVDDLTRLSDMILFSAAIPYQGGVNHVNEQPLSYWVKKFEKRGYELRDVIRPDIWDDKRIQYFYRQNMVMFVKRGSMSYELLDKRADNTLLDVIHPEIWEKTNIKLQGRLGKVFLRLENVMIKIRAWKNGKN